MSYLQSHPNAFVHLHLHTQYSLLDGAIRISDLMKEAAAMGMPAVAQTDHGHMFGAIDFYKAANAAKVKPIIGCEIYFTNGSRHEKHDKKSNFIGVSNSSNHNNNNNNNSGNSETLQSQDENESKHHIFHLVLLAKDKVGYHNLMKIVSRANMEGFYYKPRADLEILQRYSEGLIALSACLKGETGYYFCTGQDERAIDAINKYREIYKDDFYLEVQENGLEEQKLANKKLIKIARELSIPLVATNDCHYLKREDALAQEVLLCIQTAKTMEDERRMRLTSNEFFLKSPEEMRKAFSHLPEAIENTLRIADKCNLQLSYKDAKGNPIYFFPDFPVEKGDNITDYFKRIAVAGLEERFSGPHFRDLINREDWELEVRQKYCERLESELEMIIRMGFAGYYLIVGDFITWAKSNKIPVGPGRGSGVGSLVAYAMKITNIDPIAFNLLFERFVNPERVSLPDFDVDFCQFRRDEVINYVTQKYGKERVGQIITFGKLLARGVIRDVARVLSVPYSDADALAKLVPDELKITLEDAILKEPKLNEWAERDPKIRQVLNISRRLEGLLRHASIHAAGVVITNHPLEEHAPLFRGKNGEQVVAFDKDFSESVGLVKFDFLGLKTLTVIDNAEKFIRKLINPTFDIESIDLCDRKVFDYISTGETLGMFQIESSGMRDLCVRIAPDSLEDITAINALYRPGPLGSGMVDDFIERKHKRKASTYMFPELENILKDTYGIILYQEQVMNIARVLAGYSLGQADMLRRAMGKKKADVMQENRQVFINKSKERGHDEEKAAELFDLIAKFAEYGFNKSHAVAYAYIAYQTAYLKCYYPTCFFASLLSSELDDITKITTYINDAKALGIETLTPDVNESIWPFNVVDKNIRYGLGAVKNVGEAAVQEIIRERDLNGPYRSFVNFCERVNLRVVNKRVMESLIKVGAFDSFDKHNRCTLWENCEMVLSHASKVQSEKSKGQLNLFDLLNSMEDSGSGNSGNSGRESLVELKIFAEYPQREKLQYEMDLIGVYVSGHPLEYYSLLYQQLGIAPIMTTTMNTAADNANQNPNMLLAGMITHLKVFTTKKGDRMAFSTLSDLSGKIEGVIFSRTFLEHEELLKLTFEKGSPIIATGDISIGNEGQTKFFPKKILDFETRLKKIVQGMRIHVNMDQFGTASTAVLNELKTLLQENRGECLIYLVFERRDGVATLNVPKEFATEFSMELFGKISRLFKTSKIKLLLSEQIVPADKASNRNEWGWREKRNGNGSANFVSDSFRKQ
ncbi:MAG: DNA polymerase III subunit alpha [Oligoflexia bacterium]|nr:DNA polymerase III subunit alpha [Oligoflexia bacterium]